MTDVLSTSALRLVYKFGVIAIALALLFVILNLASCGRGGNVLGQS